MRFGSVPVARAEGGITAHLVRTPAGVIKKGTRLTAGHVASLRATGMEEVTVALLDEGDVHEDAAAERLACAVAGPEIRIERPFTGRSNLYAEAAGVLVVDRQRIDRLNRLDPAITIATLPEFAMVEAGRMVATVKIIPFAAPGEALARAESAARAAPPLRVAPFRPLRVGVVATKLPSLKTSVMDKTREILDERLRPTGAGVGEERRVPHEAAAVGSALAALRHSGHDLLIVFGASAVVDTHDVVPAGIEASGGIVRHLGMPVDPGNLLVLGDLHGTPVLGAPGCARSPKENGFDWVLARLLAGLDVTPEDITGLGVGGLLMEIVSRPQPREPADAGVGQGRPKVAALLLAAGQSRRMRGPNKLLARLDGKPLVRHAAEAALRSRAMSLTVVTGHMGAAIRAALDGLDVAFVHNPDYPEGLSTSLRTGVESLGPDVDAAIVMLADMPRIDADAIDRLIGAYDPDRRALVVVPTFEGKRGNPVVWSRRFFRDLAEIRGDTGARHLIGLHAESTAEVELGPAVMLDLDTPEALAAEGGIIVSEPG